MSCCVRWSLAALCAVMIAGVARSAGPSNPPSPEARPVGAGPLAFLEKDAAKWRKRTRLRHVPPRDHDRLGVERGEEPGLCGQGGDLGGHREVDQGSTEGHRQAAGHAARLEHGEHAGRLPGDDGPGRAQAGRRLRRRAEADRRPPRAAPGSRRALGVVARRRPRTGRRRSSSRTRSRHSWPTWPWGRTSRPIRRKSPRPATAARRRPPGWKSKPGDTHPGRAVRLFCEVRAGKSPEALQAGIDGFLGRQNKDGGWGQLKDLPSDAYATGQALYFLSLAGVKNDRGEMRRAWRS